ncbi:MAG: hypothetical protein R3F56_19975 [Planctomycetota bacterium]
MRFPHLSLFGAVLCATPLLSVTTRSQETVRGERVPASAISPLVLETMEQVMERERTMPKPAPVDLGWHGQDGQWIVPGDTADTQVHSGLIAIVNEWGDPKMGIGFGRPVDVVDIWAAGHGGAPASAVRFVGYRNGEEVAHTAWTPVARDQRRVSLGFAGVDRIVVQTVPHVEHFGFVALDDLTFAEAGKPQTTRTLDFEDLSFKHTLTGTDYAGLTWETGTGFKTPLEKSDIVPAPKTPQLGEGAVDDSWLPPAGAGVTTPNVWDNVIATTQGDPGANLIPPDTHGCNGPDHYLSITNSNLSAWSKTTNARVINTSLTAFFPGASGTVGDPRIVFDPHARRYIALATNFSTGSNPATYFFAVSQTTDPTAAWFKFSFVTAQGTDAGRWPDYPTLGVDARGIYAASYMVGGTAQMTLFCIDKAPLVANPPSLGTITAFRALPYESAIQPCVTHGDPGGEYCVSRQSSTLLRVRRVNPPLTAPTLTNVGSVSIPSHSSAPTAPALGSTTNINTIDARPMNAIFRNGSIYTAHNISVNGRAGCRWYEMGIAPLGLRQSGTLGDTLWHYYFASIAVDKDGNIGLGFSGSHAGSYCSTFVSARRFDDPAGVTSAPIMTKVGEASWNRLDGSGRNRFGDYSYTDVDAVDDVGFWTYQEYIFQTNIWRTRTVRFGYEASLYGIGLAGTNGVPAIDASTRPAIGRTMTLRIGNSLNANTGGALVIGSATASIPLLGGTVLVNPAAVLTIGVPAAGANLGIPLPADPALVDTPVYFQSAIVDSGAPQNVAFSRGLEVRANSR